MGKKRRQHAEEVHQRQRATKRVKAHDGDSQRNPAVDIAKSDIKTLTDLRDLLSFRQDNSPSLRLNLRRFRLFLYEVSEELSNQRVSDQASLLLGFLTASTPREDNHDSNSLPDLMQAWSFASQANDQQLLTGIPSILALLLRTISGSVDFQSVGNRLCQTILREENVALLDKGLSASVNKDQLIASCLRLLIELVSFDGGSSARSIYHQRDVTFKRLDLFLSMRTSSGGAPGESKTKPSMRTLAFEYVLLSIVHLETAAKIDLLSHPKLTRALFQDIGQDSLKSISDLLDIVRTNILLNEAFPRSVKNRIFTDVNLKQIASLFQYSEDLQLQENRPSSVADATLDFLTLVCTSRQHGILFKQDGWYPSSTKDESTKRNMSSDYSSQPVHGQTGLYRDRVPVRNTALASFLQDLRPWADVREKNLTLAIFQAAPELVADYFKRKKSFAFDPKLSMTWIGYSAFLSSVISLPVPPLDLSDMVKTRRPPPMSIIIESVMPAPLTLKAVMKCLHHSSTLIKLYATKIVISAFRKLQELILTLDSEESPHEWKAFSLSMILEFKTKVPDLQTIIKAFRGCDKHQMILRDSLACLLTLYYKVAPEMPDRDKFDVSPHLANMLQSRQLSSTMTRPSLPSFEVYSLLEVANVSFESRWWQKPGELPLSQITSILRMIAQVNSKPPQNVLSLLRSVLEEYCILQGDQGIPSLGVLLQCCRRSFGNGSADLVFMFLDNCILRFVQKPLGYSDNGRNFRESSKDKSPLSNVFVVISEQWHFFCIARNDDEITLLAQWVSEYLQDAAAAGENVAALQAIRYRIQISTECKKAVAILQAGSGDPQIDECPGAQSSPDTDLASPSMKESSSTNRDGGLDRMLTLLDQKLKPPPEPKDYPCLSSWHRKDLPDAIENSDVGNLFLYLNSKHAEIRLQAIRQLQKLMTKLKSSNYDSWRQLYLLLGVVVQTAEGVVAAEPLSSFASIIAAKFTLVLHDPRHILYTKVNEFLNHNPKWRLTKLPSNWIDKIFLLPALDGGTQDNEIEWLLEGLLQGLRYDADVDLYRRSSVFERIMSLVASPRGSSIHSKKVIELLYRCTLVGGSTTLVTRCGVLDWIRVMRSTSEAFDKQMLRGLDMRVRGKCDARMVSEWMGEDREQITDGDDQLSLQG